MDNFQYKFQLAHSSIDIRIVSEGLRIAKKSFKKTGKDGKTDRFKYATINQIYDAVEDALDEQNIVIEHMMEANMRNSAESYEILYTFLFHTPSGQYIGDSRFVTSEKPGNQGKGSANTYTRKYAVLSLCGIHPEEDNECEDEEEYIKKRNNLISEDKLESLKIAIRAHANPKGVFGALLAHFKVNFIEQLPDFSAAMTFINSFKQ